MIIAVLFALIALTGIASANINTINIVVQDTSFNPISGATISLTVPGYSTYTRTTGADGKPTTPFSGYNVASPTSAAITISKTGYSTYTSSADTFMEKTSTPGYTYTYNYPLSAPTTTAATITVQDSVNHVNIPGATVSIASASPTSLTTDNTGTTGTFSLPLTVFTIQISKSGYQGYTVTDQVVYSSTTQNLVYYIVANVAPTPTPEPAHAQVSFSVSDAATSTGIGGAAIVIRDNTNAVIGSGTTTTGGSSPGGFIHYFTPIPSSYSIVVSKSGYSDYEHTYSSSPVDDSTVSISMSAVTPTPTPTTTPPNGDEVEYNYWTATASSYYETYTASNSFDNDSNTPWVVTSLPAWIKMDYGSSPRVIQRYKIQSHTAGNYFPDDFTFQGSNDDSSWTTLDTQTNQGITTGQTKTYTFTNSNEYRYYRLYVTSGTNADLSSTNTLNIPELSLYGITATTPTPTPTPTPIPTPSITSVKVQVQDSVNHANIPGATVSIPSASPNSLTTDNTGTTGTFQVSTSSSGYIVNISVSGYASYGVTEFVDYSATSQTLIYYIVANVAPTPTAEPEHAEVKFNIYDEGTSNGVAGATVTIKDNTNTVIGTGTTTSIGNSPGGFLHYFTPVPPSYSITITKTGYTDYTFTYSSSPIDNTIQTIYISPSVLILNLDVKSAATGYLIQGASVGIYDPDHNVWRNGTASTGMVYFDSTGAEFEYPLTIGKNLTIAAWADGYQYHSQNITIFQPNYLMTLNLAPDSTLPTGDEYTIVFTVLSNFDKQPIADITVTSGLGAIKLTNSGGAATFQNVPAGVVTMFDLSGSGYLGASISATGTAGQVVMRQVELVHVGATPTPTRTGISISNTSANTDLNIKGQTFLTNWADTAINMGELIFFLLFIFFAKKILS